MILEDEYVTRCEAEHDRPVDDCEHCDFRKTVQHCELCGATWEDGELVNLPPRAFAHLETLHVLFDDYDRELLCPVVEFTNLTANKRCGDPITTPGLVACDFHAAQAVRVEGNRILRDSVATR